MAVLFSLTDSGFYLELKTKEPLKIPRRVATVETLEGSRSRDLGSYASDIEMIVEAELPQDGLASLIAVLANGKPVGFSFSRSSYQGLLESVESILNETGNSDVKISFKVTGEL